VRVVSDTRKLAISHLDRGLTVKVPTAKTPQSTALRFTDRVDDRNTGIGMAMIMRSEEMLKTMFVMRWFVAALHCAREGCLLAQRRTSLLLSGR
jgi:hypothetical protein